MINKKNNKYFLLLVILITFSIGKNAISETDIISKESVKIYGQPETVGISDIQLPAFNYDYDSFNAGFNPSKELIELLNHPKELTGMLEKEFSQDFPIEK